MIIDEVRAELNGVCRTTRIQAEGGVNLHVLRQAERYRLSHLFEGIRWNVFDGLMFHEFATPEDRSRWFDGANEVFKAEDVAGDTMRVELLKPVGNSKPGDAMDLPTSQAEYLIGRGWAKRIMVANKLGVPGSVHGNPEFRNARQEPHGNHGIDVGHGSRGVA